MLGRRFLLHFSAPLDDVHLDDGEATDPQELVPDAKVMTRLAAGATLVASSAGKKVMGVGAVVSLVVKLQVVVSPMPE